jgi:PAS domain S-box-containing protein
MAQLRPGLEREELDVGADVVETHEALLRRERQQALVAELGRSALTGTPFDALVDEALAAVVDGLAADRVGLLQPAPAGEALVCARAVGWPEDQLRPVPIEGLSQVSETYRTREPCVVSDFAAETRFPDSDHLVAHGLTSGAAVPVRGEGPPVAVLVAHSQTPGAFGGDAVVFLRAVANVLAVVVARDSAEARRRESEENLAFLAEAGHVLADSLDYDSTLATLASLVVPRLADWFIVDLVESDGTFRRVAVAATDPAKVGVLEALSREYRATIDGPSPASRALTTRTTVHFPDFTPESLHATTRDDRHYELLSSLDPSSAIAVPLLGREGVLGALTFAWSESGRRYDEAGVRLAEELARRAASAIENARLYGELEQRAEVARALATVADGVCLLDGGGVIKVWNPAAAAITGLAAEEVLGRPIADCVGGWEEAAATVPLAAPDELSSTAPRTVPVSLGGRDVWLSVVGVAAGGATAYTFRDVTDERRLERVKSDFVATVSHELRTPLAAVYGAALTLARPDLADREELRTQLVRQIVEQSERLAAIIDDILLAAELEAGRLRIRPSTLDPVESAREAVEAVRSRVGNGASIEVVAGGHVHPVRADRNRLRQILDNLLENAVKYSPPGTPIAVHVDGDDRHVRVAVADRGVGIPANELDRIFEKFYRLDPDQHDGVGGNGLGLFVCRELVQRMGGQISVESRVGHGSRFVVELPRAGTG